MIPPVLYFWESRSTLFLSFDISFWLNKLEYQSFILSRVFQKFDASPFFPGYLRVWFHYSLFLMFCYFFCQCEILPLLFLQHLQSYTIQFFLTLFSRNSNTKIDIMNALFAYNLSLSSPTRYEKLLFRNLYQLKMHFLKVFYQYQYFSCNN